MKNSGKHSLRRLFGASSCRLSAEDIGREAVAARFATTYPALAWHQSLPINRSVPYLHILTLLQITSQGGSIIRQPGGWGLHLSTLLRIDPSAMRDYCPLFQSHPCNSYETVICSPYRMRQHIHKERGAFRNEVLER